MRSEPLDGIAVLSHDPFRNPRLFGAQARLTRVEAMNANGRHLQSLLYPRFSAEIRVQCFCGPA